MTTAFLRISEPGVDFKLFRIDEDLPPKYRVVTVQEVEDNREAFTRAMPGREKANLADGSADGYTYGARVRSRRRTEASHKLAALSELLREPDLTFTLFPSADELPLGYRSVTIREADDNLDAVKRAMLGCEIANLADGSVEGFEHGVRVRFRRRYDVGHNLAAPSKLFREVDMDFKLFPVEDDLPPEYCLVTIREAEDNREAVRRAMPGWQIANLADGSMDGFAYGARIRPRRRNDVGHKLAALSELLRPR